MTDMLKVMFIDPVSATESTYAEAATDTEADTLAIACAAEHGINVDDVWVVWPEQQDDDADAGYDFDGEKERRMIARGKL